MMDWIHCNNCLALPNSQNKAFVLTSCGHIFCELCENQALLDHTCKVCARKCSLTKLGPQMKPEVQDFFNDPKSMLEKVVQVLEFQKDHRSRLTEANKVLVEKYDRAKLYIRRLEDELKTLKREVEYYAKTAQTSPVCNVPFRTAGVSSSPTPSVCSKMNNQFLTRHPTESIHENLKPTDTFAKPNYLQMQNRNLGGYRYGNNMGNQDFSHGFASYANSLNNFKMTTGRTPPANTKFPLVRNSRYT